ncbi:MAG: DAK2 domain-containing protein [Clostridia bacterium]|nr:DAK2 domain-containing protein [Clostridia bacterium]
MSKKVIDGEQFQKMVASAANSLDTEKTEINNLNVFPVPDGDTGINMSLTMKPAREIQVEPGTLAEAASRVANRLLRAARGNSGAILSLFFRGMSKSFEGLETADSEDIAKAIRSGTNEAYRAVSKPAEGTILTVMRGTAEIAEAESEQFKGNPEAFFERLLEGAEEVLEQTPEMLPVLKQANVVDAGGQGFVTMLKGMLASLKGHDVAAVEGSDDESAERDEGADFGEFDTDSITFAYCTECIVGKSDEFRGEGTAEAFKEYISPLGDSMVFVDDEEIIKVHIHTNDPGMVLSEAVKYGALEMVKIENMKKQHSALTSAGEKAAKGEIDAPVDYTPDKDFGFVAVCLGEGTAKIFRELGVHEIVTGGQTMNPSTDNLLDAIRKTRGREVFVLPNNKNIIMVANQAAAIIEAEVAEGLIPEQRVIVLETRSVPEGMSAMLAFDPDSPADDNAAAMTETFGMVHTLSVTRAVKDAAIDGISIKAGEYMGLCDRKIGYTGTDYEIIILEMLRNFPDASFVTVLYGDEVTEENANIIFEKMKAVVPEAECSLLFGGQPLYDFVISVE